MNVQFPTCTKLCFIKRHSSFYFSLILLSCLGNATCLCSSEKDLHTTVLEMPESQRAFLCNEILSSSYFKNAGIKYMLGEDAVTENVMLQEHSDKLGLYFSKNDPKSRIVHPIVIQRVMMPSFQIELPMIACLARKSNSREFKEFFVSDGFQKYTFFLFTRNPLENIVPLGIVELEPGWTKTTNQSMLEKLYLEQRLKTGTASKITRSTKEDGFDTLSASEKFRLASSIFDPGTYQRECEQCKSLMNSRIHQRECEHCKNSALNIAQESQKRRVRFITNEYSNVDLTADVQIVTCPICVPEKTDRPLVKRDTKYFISHSNDENNAVFVFREDKRGESIILDSYIPHFK